MKRQANIHFLRMLASDELIDTLYFSTGESPLKEKSSSYTKLSAAGIEVKISHNRLIKVNGNSCRSIWEAKNSIARAAGLDGSWRLV